jgi:membrane associated rhomboid family serine protease
MFRLTPVVKNILIINALMFFGSMLAPNQLTAYLALWNSKSGNFQPFQLFTYMFLHANFMHLFFNMLSFAFFAPQLESYWGQKRFTTFFLVTGIGAGIFNFLVSRYLGEEAASYTVGASGAVYGILAGFGMIFPETEIMLMIPPIPIKAKYLVFLLGGLTFMMDKSGQVAHFAHLGGVVFALFLITAWGRR